MSRSKRPVPKLPAFFFYPGDWKKDPQLSNCSPSTRGIWIDLICSMHENGRSGKVTGTVKELAQNARCSERQLQQAIDELERTGTANVARDKVALNVHKSAKRTIRPMEITLENRKMAREAKARAKDRLRKRKRRATKSGPEVVRPLSSGSSSSSSSSSSKEEDLVSKKNREEEGLRCESEDPPPDVFSEEFFENLQDQKKFQHCDVREVFGKWKNHCQVTGKELDPKYFLNWLNRERGDLRNASSDEEISRIVARLS